MSRKNNKNPDRRKKYDDFYCTVFINKYHFTQGTFQTDEQKECPSSPKIKKDGRVKFVTINTFVYNKFVRKYLRISFE